jgi:ubiquitin-protein ligase
MIAIQALTAVCADLKKSPVDYFSAGLVDDANPFEWDITIIGPTDTLLYALIYWCPMR